MSFQSVDGRHRERLSDVVAAQIRGLVATGKLQPGQPLPGERELAAQLEVSRPSLREALVRLESGGFIESRGRSGFVVADVTAAVVARPLATLLAERPEARAAVLELWRDLESLAAGYAADRAGKAHLHRIGAAAAEPAEKAAPEMTTNAAVQEDAFQAAVAEAAGNPVLAYVLHGLRDLMRQPPGPTADPAAATKLGAQRKTIFAAIEDRRPKRARKAAAAHVDTLESLRSSAQEAPATP